MPAAEQWEPIEPRFPAPLLNKNKHVTEALALRYMREDLFAYDRDEQECKECRFRTFMKVNGQITYTG